MNASEELFGESEFLVNDRLWFVAPKERPVDPERLAAILIRANTSSGVHPIVFTDADLANQFIEKINATGRLSPFSYVGLKDFAAFLVVLARSGETRIGIDPYGTKVRAIPIERILAGIRNRGR